MTIGRVFGCNPNLQTISNGVWRKIFQEHLYDKHFVIDRDTMRLQGQPMGATPVSRLTTLVQRVITTFW
jgi:hypothetical protein